MEDEYEVIEIKFTPEDLEQLGTKEKFWFRFGPEEDVRWLFKYSRDNTGEHWSEKAAEQLCKLLEIPHAKYELAFCHDRAGVITKNLIADAERMVMGNEVLHALSPNDYPSPTAILDGEKAVRIREHTVLRVLGCLDGTEVQPPVSSINTGSLNAGDVFCGYLMLDAIISNQDRHHENWAIIVGDSRSLCPTYDHAASLGRELLDENRIDRLTTKDKQRSVSAFVGKARSEIFKLKTDRKPLHTIDAFYHATEKRAAAKEYWLSRIRKVRREEIEAIFLKIPSSLISENARKFAIEMTWENIKRLLKDERA